MNSLNSILMEGNLTKDPELKETAKGTKVCTFTVASNRYYKKDDEQQQEVSFFPVEVWAGLAESCNQYLKKGRGVRVVGRIKQDRWKDQDDKNHEKFKIVAEHVEFKPLFTKNDKENVSDDGNKDKSHSSEEDLLEAI
ncbi:MAG: single-stranded DNA-binding protein [Spirochaetales bacterium]|nr:single-stranded DNA-binding protein [Spirochaetales bacterium]